MNESYFQFQVKSIHLVLFFLLLVQVFGNVGPDAHALQEIVPSNGNSAQLPKNTLPRQPWQIRRDKFWSTFKNAKLQDADANKDLDAVLTEFESQPFSRTPMENMDILGSFYVPKDGVEKAFVIVIANATLGWYDALRFGSESGRAEIQSNERFFLRAYFLSGPKTTEQFKQFIKEHPDQAQTSLMNGLLIAEKMRKNPRYDVRWPTAYGMERMICALGGSCERPKEMPEDQWDKAWVEAKQRVTTYFSVSTKQEN